jgi:hypothetical protein
MSMYVYVYIDINVDVDVDVCVDFGYIACSISAYNNSCHAYTHIYIYTYTHIPKYISLCILYTIYYTILHYTILYYTTYPCTGMALCRYYDLSNMFLPTLAATTMHTLRHSIEPVHYLMDVADQASQSLGVEKKSRVQV